MWWGDREVRASWGLDYFVAPEAEGLGDSISLMKAWMQRVEVAFVLGLAPTSYLICKRLGFRDLGYVPLFQAVLDPAAIVRRRSAGVAGAVAAPFSNAAMRMVPSPTRARSPAIRTWQPAGEIRRGDYDDLWQRARTGFAMCVRRDAAYSPVAVPARAEQAVRHPRSSSRWRTRRVRRLATQKIVGGIRLGSIVDLFAGPGRRPERATR